MRGSLVALAPLEKEHGQQLLEAADLDRRPFTFTSVPRGAAEMGEYVALALRERDAGRALPYAVLDARDGDRVLGTTRFFNIERWELGGGRSAAVAEIGYTWLAAAVQGTGANTEMKLLMLDYAFGKLSLMRIAFMTDARNTRSRRAIERVGATSEGVRRAHMPAFDGGVRDSAFYSLLRDEWPAARTGLLARLAATTPGPHQPPARRHQ